MGYLRGGVDGAARPFAPGSLTMGPHTKLNLDHDPTQPVGVLTAAEPSAAGLMATFHIPAGPRGDQALADAAAGLRDGLSVGADVDAADTTDDGTYVTAAHARHVALLSEPAYDTARVTHVAASTPPSGAPPMPTPLAPVEAAAPEPAPEPVPVPEPVEPETPDDVLTAAGRAGLVAAALPGVFVRDPYPSALPHRMGGPSFVRDAYASETNPGSVEAARWRKAQAMADEPAFSAPPSPASGGSTPPPVRRPPTLTVLAPPGPRAFRAAAVPEGAALQRTDQVRHPRFQLNHGAARGEQRRAVGQTHG